MTVNIAVIAHDVSVPIYRHRSKEFSERMYFMAKRFNEVHIISKEKNISYKDRVPIEDELASNLIVHKVHGSLVSANLDILRLVRDVGSNVMFADGIGHGASCLLCKKRYTIPLITFIQGYEADLKAIGLKLKFGMKPTPGLLSKTFAMYDLVVLRASDKVLCVSQGLVEYAHSLLAKKDWDRIEFIPHSLQYVRDIPKEAMMWAEGIIGSLKASNEQGFLSIMVVGIGPMKGTEVALKAHKCIVKKNPDAVMILVGKTIDPKYVRMVKELGLKYNILFLQTLPRDHVLALLSHASIFLCPSFSEGFSWAVAEAMALGIPVVAYTNKSLIEAANKGAVVAVRTTDPKDCARECISLLRGEQVKEELVQKAKDYIQPFVLFPQRKRFELICNNIDDVLSMKH